jgi:hypothetical protein
MHCDRSALRLCHCRDATQAASALGLHGTSTGACALGADSCEHMVVDCIHAQAHPRTISLAATGNAIEVIDRSRLAAALATQHLLPPSQSDAKAAVELGKSIGASTVVVGSYGAAENGIGVSLAAFPVPEDTLKRVMLGMVFGKIPLTQEVSAHLNAPLDSLRPKDGIYKLGYGGVSIPSCIKCTITGMFRTHQRARVVAGHLPLWAEDVRDDGLLGDRAHGTPPTAVRP